ncbi:hypothetical protein [Kitasatospora paranensis]
MPLRRSSTAKASVTAEPSTVPSAGSSGFEGEAVKVGRLAPT